MFSSIRCAAGWSGWQASLSHIVITLGDQPHLRPATLAALLAFSAQRRDKICQPSSAGWAKHPVVLPRHIFEALPGGNHETLAHFLRANHSDVELLEIDDPGLNLDLDTPADYEDALSRNSG